MKERLILLCMTYPTTSKKYGSSVCMAGITEDGEFRRIYPIPFNTFLKRKDRFKKRHIIEYEIREKGDYRKESYKVYPDSIRVLTDEIDYNEGIRELGNKYSTSLEELQAAWINDRTSLGIVKPVILDMNITSNKQQETTIQCTLEDGGGIMPEMLKHSFVYHFRCSDSCDTIHKCSCLDTEIGQLYRKLKSRYSSELTAAKVKERFVTWMKETREPYFMMGTHSFHPRSWMVISVLYPKKDNIITLKNFAKGVTI